MTPEENARNVKASKNAPLVLSISAEKDKGWVCLTDDDIDAFLEFNEEITECRRKLSAKVAATKKKKKKKVAATKPAKSTKKKDSKRPAGKKKKKSTKK